MGLLPRILQGWSFHIYRPQQLLIIHRYKKPKLYASLICSKNVKILLLDWLLIEQN